MISNTILDLALSGVITKRILCQNYVSWHLAVFLLQYFQGHLTDNAGTEECSFTSL